MGILGSDANVEKIMGRYGMKIDSRLGPNMMDEPGPEKIFSKDYTVFRDEALKSSLGFYEQACNFAEKVLKVEPKPEDAKKLDEAIERCHLGITPAGAYSLGTLVMIMLIILGVAILGISFFLTEAGITCSTQLLLPIILIIGGIACVKIISNYPLHLAMKWRLQASNQMVLCILYIVMYMRHTSNLEHAIKFAGEHIGNPLALDLRKIVWDVETQKYSNIKTAIDIYLEQWKDFNLEFIEAFHLIESSLFEGNEQRRVELLEKALEVMLEGTYNNMMHYAQETKGPITTLHMLGVILPVLGLIILPLVGAFMGVKWYQLALLYNIALPIGVYFMGYRIMAKRPVGYAQTNIYESHPKYRSMRMYISGGVEVSPKKIAWIYGSMIVLIGLLPLVMHMVMPGTDFPIGDPEQPFGWILEYKDVDMLCGDTEVTKTAGPFGIGASLLSLLITLGIAVGMGMYYKIRSNRLMVVRNETKKLENEFQGALFQLGNRLGSGIPTEMAFSSVAETLHGTPTGNFFAIVDNNIRRGGMSVRNAIFDEKVGAINEYPSSLIDSSMRVLVETSNKGPAVVSKAMINISTYLDRINKVNERLKDLLAETSSSMKAQVSFLSPVISGIVVGIGTMITAIMGGLASTLEMQGGAETGGLGGIPIDMFDLSGLMPPYFLQIVVGIYLVEVIYVLTILGNGIENGVDKLNEEYSLGKNLYKGTVFYIVVAGLTMLVFNALAAMIAQKALAAG
ncbi:MAG: hypothetical protein PHO02_01365 [Candidatus Nanoarchaeia archaeon]|nr:hypothetical protein [Candidatus Nanoarchaeia archaeon]